MAGRGDVGRVDVGRREVGGWRAAVARRPSRAAALVEFGALALWFGVFARLHAATGLDVAAARAHALTLQSWERALHLDIEPAANRWLGAHPALIPPAVACYRLYYVVLAGVLVWVFVRHADGYPRVRRTLVAMTVLVLPVYWAVPMSPPRFALPGIVDIIVEHDLLGAHAPGVVGQTAMPSMHMGYAAWCAYAVWTVLRPSHPRGALLPWAFPLAMLAVVLTTGSHYVLDVVGTAILFTASLAAATGWGRLVERRRGSSTGSGPLAELGP